MKKFFVIACIVSIAFFGLAYDSSSQGAFVLHIEGTIEDLEIDFGSSVLPVELPGIGTLNVTYVEIVAKGTEHLVITESGQYNYWADLGPGTIYVTTLNSNGNGKPKPVTIPITMESASISEHYNVQDSSSEDPNLAPIDSVDLYFKTTLVLDGEQTFDFTLKLKSGEVQIISS
jgi:hypothetical protein